MIIYTSDYVRNSKRNSLLVELKDNANTAVTGKVFTDITATVVRWGQPPDSVTMVALANARAAFSAGGWAQLSAAQYPGLYRLDIPNTAFVNDGVTDNILVSVLCTGCQPVYVMIPLTDRDGSAGTRDRS